MTTSRQKKEALLITAFKTLLKEQTYGSQSQLAVALDKQGFKNMSQAKISRMLSKLGAVKMRNTKGNVVYVMPEELAVPKSKQAIESVVVSVKHNNMQIILKTGIGGASLISRMLDSLGESSGILGTLAGDDTIFIAPTDASRIDEITQEISMLLGVSTQN